MSSLSSLAPVAALLAIIASLLSASAAAAPDREASRSGEEVVQHQCVLCHGPGVGGAPKIGDGRAWTERAHAGIDNLMRSAIKGRGGMPPSGGVPDLSEAELRASIVYMLRRSGVEARD